MYYQSPPPISSHPLNHPVTLPNPSGMFLSCCLTTKPASSFPKPKPLISCLRSCVVDGVLPPSSKTPFFSRTCIHYYCSHHLRLLFIFNVVYNALLITFSAWGVRSLVFWKYTLIWKRMTRQKPRPILLLF